MGDAIHPELHVVLVANYPPDAQQSMLRFARVLERELRRRGCVVTVAAPRAVLGRIRPGRHGAGKWLGYADKFLIFPVALRAALRRAHRDGPAVVVHVCDHSNAIYTRYLRAVPHVVTCNDLLAVRSALRETPQHATRWSGRILQRLILAGLNRAQSIACISEATRQDVLRLCSVERTRVRRVYMGLNHPYRQMPRDEARQRIAHLVPDGPFMLHVGGNQWYKNRPGVLRIYAALKQLACDRPSVVLVMVGAPFTKTMRDFVEANGLGRDVIALQDTGNDELQSLYSAAELLLYPSLAEGFGWPVLEAMACGCPVVTSNRAPMTEVAGDTAALIDPDDVVAAAQTVSGILAECADARRTRIERGLAQAARFGTDVMMDAYVAMYRDVLPADADV